MMTRFWLIKLFHSVRVKIIFEGNYIKSVLFCSFFLYFPWACFTETDLAKVQRAQPQIDLRPEVFVSSSDNAKSNMGDIREALPMRKDFLLKKSQIILCICYSVLVLVVYYLFRFSWAWIGLDVLVPLAQLKRRKASAAFLLGCSALMLWNHIPRDSFKQPSILLSN